MTVGCLVGVLPHPGARGIGRAEGLRHGLPEDRGIGCQSQPKIAHFYQSKIAHFERGVVPRDAVVGGVELGVAVGYRVGAATATSLAAATR